MADACNIVESIDKSHNNDSLYDVVAEELRKCKDTILKIINSSNLSDKQDTYKNEASINENDNDNEADGDDYDYEADDNET